MNLVFVWFLNSEIWKPAYYKWCSVLPVCAPWQWGLASVSLATTFNLVKHKLRPNLFLKKCAGFGDTNPYMDGRFLLLNAVWIILILGIELVQNVSRRASTQRRLRNCGSALHQQQVSKPLIICLFISPSFKWHFNVFLNNFPYVISSLFK